MKLLKYFIYGFLLAFAINFFPLSGCEEIENFLDDDKEKEEETTSNTEVEDASNVIEDIFLDKDVEKLRVNLTAAAQEEYKDVLSDIQPYMDSYGEAFKTRQLEYSNELYAIYSFTSEGVKYTVTFAKQDDGSWKLIRF